jgi:hypothetical protein
VSPDNSKSCFFGDGAMFELYEYISLYGNW